MAGHGVHEAIVPLPSSEKEESLKSKKKKDDKLRDRKNIDSN